MVSKSKYSHNQIQDFLVIWWKVKFVKKIWDAVEEKEVKLWLDVKEENDNTEADDLTWDIDKHVSKCVLGGSVDGNG